MDAIDILGSLLGHKKSRGGRGGKVLTDIFGRGSSRSTQTPSPSRPPSEREIRRDADQLEDLLNVAQGRSTGSVGGSDRGIPTPRSRPMGNPPDDNEQALVLVRAMISAAKADGRLDQEEQEAILKQLSNPSPNTLRFLREEFQRPVNIRELVASVPFGMEQQVYTMSLIAIDLDTRDEAKYLIELSELLRLPPNVCDEIHRRIGAPSIS